uniref:coiled-coil domain-containing protein 25-like isoform X2 n=1 Tax=Oncorhynchus gorbuscha TaxID=8017 RepID=UPI001EAF883F|nr:coiled-coil domain-containing protein 25-like isoform X2 [Oncorhynchus gorbuscha]
MGKDKYEHDLIKYGWPEDIWFHVDELSSAHVYLRMPKGLTIEDIPKEVLIDCVQLVKNNSIQGNTLSGPIKIVAVERKMNEIVNRLEKTKDERYPDLAAEKESRDTEERNEKKAQIQDLKKKDKDGIKKKRELDELNSYSSLMTSDNMTTTEDGNDSDDFM